MSNYRYNPYAWPDPDLATLKRGHKEGRSFSDIAASLGNRYSRNACIGMAHRMGLRRFELVSLMSRRQRQQELPRNRGADGGMASGLAARLKKARETTIASIAMHKSEDRSNRGLDAVSIFKATPSQCRWPLNEVGGPNGVPLSDFRFCGARILDGSSYCETHRRRSIGKFRAEAAE